jgi:hypothetical protein
VTLGDLCEALHFLLGRLIREGKTDDIEPSLESLRQQIRDHG